MKTFSFISLKGGVGKTASALSVAQELGRRGHSVLLVDLDPQNAATSHYLTHEVLIENPYSVGAILKGKTDAILAAVSVDYNETSMSRIDLIPSEIELSLIDHELGNVPNREYLLYEALSLVETRYDYCVIDTPPMLGFLTYSAAIASDRVIVPTQLEKWAVRATGTTLRGLELCRKSQRYIGKSFEAGILPTFWSERNRLYRTIMEMLSELHGPAVLPVNVPGLVEVKKTFTRTRGELPEGKARAAYAALTDILEA